jgi:1-deoxy-D-xylulose-5-phosphate synthase
MYDISYLLSIPRMDVVAPTTCIELVETIKISKDYNSGPLAIRFPRNNCFSMTAKKQEFKVGKWFEALSGEKDIIIATGSMLEQVCKIKDELKEKGLNPTIVSAAWIRPFDEEYLLENISKYDYIHVLEENSEVNGFASMIINFLNDNGISKRVNKIGLKHDFIEHASRDEILSEQGLKGSNLVKRILEGR